MPTIDVDYQEESVSDYEKPNSWHRFADCELSMVDYLTSVVNLSTTTDDRLSIVDGRLWIVGYQEEGWGRGGGRWPVFAQRFLNFSFFTRFARAA